MLLRNSLFNQKFSLSSRLLHSSRKNYNIFTKILKAQMSPNNSPPYFHITQIGDPVLRSAAQLVPTNEIQNSTVQSLVQHMIETMRKNNLVGIAAPQVGISLQIIVMEFSEKAKAKYSPEIFKIKNMEILPLTVLINPKLTITNYQNKKIFQEGCGSIRGYAADVARFEEAQVNGLNEKGETIELKLKGWNARIVQHETDHLKGQLFVDLMDTKTFVCTCWEDVNRLGGRIEIPFYPKN